MKGKVYGLMVALIFVAGSFCVAKSHGTYELVIKNSSRPIDELTAMVSTAFREGEFRVRAVRIIGTPNIVRERTADHCPYQARLIVLSHEGFTSKLVSYQNKYIVGALLRIAIFENENGTQVSIADPETAVRLIANDLDIERYNSLARYAHRIKNKIRRLITGLDHKGILSAQKIPPLREEDDLRVGSADIPWIIGDLTWFRDFDQTIVLRKVHTRGNGTLRFKTVLNEIKTQISKFAPVESDRKYENYTRLSDLKWKLVAVVRAVNRNAAVLGLSRERTEALALDVVGKSREDDRNTCPGLDHAGAFPIEIGVWEDGRYIYVGMLHPIVRLDQYFWDARLIDMILNANFAGTLNLSLKIAVTGKKGGEQY
ncbi:MAG: hypothetical protein GXO82_06545 [Chlorobi bacterium]|nr:hypothetical protein [Chlorobiota bacterium]